jgi:hypothetical protein
MQDINPTELTTVVGGAKKTDEITQQLTALQTSIKDATTTTNNGGGNNTFMLLAMMMAMRPQQPTVVAGGGPPVVAAGPVVNISSRVRHW